MSEIRVDTITEKTSGSGTTVSNLKNPNEPFRNLVVNGDMQLFQRGTATTTVVNGSYQTADRFKFYESTDGAYTSEYDNLSVADQATTGQRAALELNVTTADGTIAAAQFAAVYHVLEGKNLQHLLYGTSASKDLTLSFWVKSNKTGTYSLQIQHDDASKYKLFEYTDSLSPEQKTESHFNLVEHITTKDKTINLSETIKHLPKDEDLRIITYKTLLEKFNQKYTKLSSAQKNLLKEYINNVSGTNSLKDTLKELVRELKKDLKTHSKKLQDKVVKIKMTEAINSIEKMCGLDNKSKMVKDSHVTQTMRYLELLKEVKKSGNNNKKTL